MKLKPLGDHLIAKPIIEDKTTKSGIVLPDTAKEKPEQAEVTAVGEGRVLDSGTRLAMSVKPGDKILFKKYAPDEIKIDGEDYLVLSEAEIIAVIE